MSKEKKQLARPLERVTLYKGTQTVNPWPIDVKGWLRLGWTRHKANRTKAEAYVKANSKVIELQKTYESDIENAQKLDSGTDKKALDKASAEFEAAEKAYDEAKTDKEKKDLGVKLDKAKSALDKEAKIANANCAKVEDALEEAIKEAQKAKEILDEADEEKNDDKADVEA